MEGTDVVQDVRVSVDHHEPEYQEVQAPEHSEMYDVHSNYYIRVDNRDKKSVSFEGKYVMSALRTDVCIVCINPSNKTCTCTHAPPPTPKYTQVVSTPTKKPKKPFNLNNACHRF